MGRVKIRVPKRIELRWRKYYNVPPVYRRSYNLTRALKMGEISAEKFKKSWIYVHPRLSTDDLFSLFKDSGFSPNHEEIAGRIVFARNVMQQYEDMTRSTKTQKVFLMCALCVL